MLVKVTEDKELAEKIRKQLRANDGYCPCALEHIIETKCMCKNFREEIKEGSCHCGLYIKVKEN